MKHIACFFLMGTALLLFLGTTYVIQEGGVEVGRWEENDGKDAVEIIDNRIPMRTEADTSEMPDIPAGDSIVLTIDREIQAMVENLLDAAVDEYDAKSGTVIIMHPKTGAIMAMATSPRLDINEYWRFPEVYPGTTPFNRAISQTFEPGSVFKVFTMAAALDSETVDLETTFLDTGYFEYGGIVIRNGFSHELPTEEPSSQTKNKLSVGISLILGESHWDYTLVKPLDDAPLSQAIHMLSSSVGF